MSDQTFKHKPSTQPPISDLRRRMLQFETLPAWRRGLEVPPVLGTIADSQRRPGTAESDPKLSCLPDVDCVAPILLSGLPSLATYLRGRRRSDRTGGPGLEAERHYSQLPE